MWLSPTVLMVLVVLVALVALVVLVVLMVLMVLMVPPTGATSLKRERWSLSERPRTFHKTPTLTDSESLCSRSDSWCEGEQSLLRVQRCSALSAVSETWGEEALRPSLQAQIAIYSCTGSDL
ncbi:hypothetical protein EYF80_050248 [Liparis tanakae]|uniref:Uncharacterized protein n=1 Tax=Liparis tanakae TaxID=230148 RepID=A0A4Z2FFQ3_9TELE|nr:hypothetical protein EYF80_050248 [Liparis tanakae]